MEARHTQWCVGHTAPHDTPNESRTQWAAGDQQCRSVDSRQGSVYPTHGHAAASSVVQDQGVGGGGVPTRGQGRAAGRELFCLVPV